MDVLFSIGRDRFIWDSEKAAANLTKHGVSFTQACEIFLDPVLLLEDATAGEEQRWAGVGMTRDWKLTCVVHIVREGDVVRLISARRATPAERERYENDE